jgi:hypothetical protein
MKNTIDEMKIKIDRMKDQLQQKDQEMKDQLQQKENEIKILQNSLKPKSTRIEINDHNGIINELRQKDSNSVLVEASNIRSGNPVQNILTFDNKYWYCEKYDSSVVFQFKTKKVKISKYLLRNVDTANSYYQGWKVEGSNNQKDWELIDQRSDQSCFNQAFQSCLFDCQSNSFYSFIRITQTQKPKSGSNRFGFTFVEFGGEILDE